MAKARFAWGIDIGNRALKAVKLVRSGGKVKVEEYEVIEHETVLSNSGDNRETLVIAALANFVQRHQIKPGTPVAIGVSGQSSFARFIKLPPVETKKIPEIVRFEAIQQIPFPLDDVEWSYQLFQQPDSPDTEVGIFAMRKELVEQHVKHFTDVDLNVQVVQMNPLAVYNAIAYDGRIEGTTMIVDLGAENTDLIISEGESIWMRSIAIGGNNFTEALVKSFKLNFQKAEDLKRNAATSKYARQIFQAMRPVFAELVAEIQRSIGFYASVHRESKIAKVLALGGTFKLPGLQKYLQQNLQLDVERVDGFRKIEADSKVGASLTENTLSMASSYGLALQAMGEAKITSSLLPTRIRREIMWREKVKWFGAAAALFVLGTGMAYGSHYMNQATLTSQGKNRQDIQRIIKQAEAKDKEWAAVENAGAAERALIGSLNSLRHYKDIWKKVIVDLHKALPPPPEELLGDNLADHRKIPRPQRGVINVEEIKFDYQPDLSNQLNQPQQQQEQAPVVVAAPPPNFNNPQDIAAYFRGQMGIGQGNNTQGGRTRASGAPITSGIRGFNVTIECTTPHADGPAFLNRTLMKNLREVKKGSGRGFYFTEPQIVRGVPLGSDTRRTQQRGPLAAQGDPFVDPVTGEDMRNDWLFTIRFNIVIE